MSSSHETSNTDFPSASNNVPNDQKIDPATEPAQSVDTFEFAVKKDEGRLEGGEDQHVAEPPNGRLKEKGKAEGYSEANSENTQGPEDILERTATLSLNIPQTPTSTMSPTSNNEDSPPPPPPPKDEKYSTTENQSSGALDLEKEALKGQDANYEDETITDAVQPKEGITGDSDSEIQSIMEQFDSGMGAPGPEEIMSPRMGIAGPLLGSSVGHPPRKSSLEPLRPASQTSLPTDSRKSSHDGQAPPPRSSSLVHGAPIMQSPITSKELPESPPSPLASRSSLQPPPPDPDLPFDFHRFLEQLRHRTADPVAKFLRSFLLEFGKKQWMVHEQVKIVSDFLEFIAKKMAQCEVWRTVSDAEFDNACEGMEKLVMNRLYSQTFSPAIPPPDPAAIAARGKRRAGQAPPPGRRGQHQEDVERDEVLAQKVRIYSWVREEHLDINPLTDKGKKFLVLAQQELLKIGNYRAPRDKVICILNSCKVIFGFLRNAQHDQSADSFVPLLIYTVLRANPPNLVSSVQYVLRFRNANKLTGEAGYYVSSLGGAIDFIERLDRTSLTISDQEFEKNVEASVSAIAERHPPESEDKPPALPHRRPRSRAGDVPESSLDGDGSSPQRLMVPREGNKSDSEGEEHAAVAGLLRTIQRPLSTIGRIFSDEGTPARVQTQPPSTPQPPPKQTLAPLPRGANDAALRSSPDPFAAPPGSVEDSAARQASQEAEQARKIRAREEGNAVETLCGMFPGLDREVVVDVVRANEGRIGSAVDACLALSG